MGLGSHFCVVEVVGIGFHQFLSGENPNSFVFKSDSETIFNCWKYCYYDLT